MQGLIIVMVQKNENARNYTKLRRRSLSIYPQANYMSAWQKKRKKNQ